MKRVQFPDGTVVTGLGLVEHRDDDPHPDYGLYIHERWSPTWSAGYINWPDFGLPATSRRRWT